MRRFYRRLDVELAALVLLVAVIVALDPIVSFFARLTGLARGVEWGLIVSIVQFFGGFLAIIMILFVFALLRKKGLL